MIGFAVPPDRAAAVPASRPATSKRKRAPRAVVRWRLMSSGSRGRYSRFAAAGPAVFALDHVGEARHPNKSSGDIPPIESGAGMKIAVCAKAVPEQARRIDPETKRLGRPGEQTLNPFDANAGEEG